MKNNLEQVTIDIKYWPNSPHLEKISEGDWIDLYTYEDVSFTKDDFKLIRLGIAMKLPEGYEAILAPRSSTYKRWGLTQVNSIGVIDSSYCGNDDMWLFAAKASKSITIPKGTRLCQFRIQKSQPDIIFNEVENLSSPSRGSFGSTGA